MPDEHEGPTNATRDDGTRYYRGGCVRGMPTDGACYSGCLHRQLVESYRDGRRAWEDEFEDTTGTTYRPGIIEEQRRAERRGGRNEVGDFIEAHPPPTFRDWLEANAGRSGPG